MAVSPTVVSTSASITDLGFNNEKFNKAKVTRVIDGDTIELENGQKLRYIGINTPETVDPRRGVQCYGKEASLRNQELVLNKEIYLEKDVSETDKYGRLLRYVYLDLNDISVNEQLVKEGYAISSSYPPDVKYQDKLKLAQQQAEIQQKGLWQEGGCAQSESLF